MRLVLYVSLTALLALAEAGPASRSASQEHSAEKHSCHDLLKETPSNNPQSLGYACPLLNAISHYCSCGCTAAANGAPGSLSPSDVNACQAWIAEVEVKLEACGGQINDSVVVEISDSLEELFEVNVNLKLQIGWLSINDSTGAYWGSCHDLISVSVDLQFEIVESSGCLEIDTSSGHCPVTDAIRNAAQASGNPSIQSDCESLCIEIEAMLDCGLYNETEELAFIAQICEEHSELVEWLKVNVHIEVFGSFRSLLRVCKTNDRVQKMHHYMHGSSADDCDFLADFKHTFLATCVVGQSNFSQCGILGNLYAEINVTFSGSVDIEVRMKAVANHIYQMMLVTPWICSIELESCGCTLYEIMACSSFCHNQDCCSWEGPPPTLPPSSSTVASTSAASTGSTAAASTGSTAAASTASTAAASTGSTAAGTTKAASTAAPTTVSTCGSRGTIISNATGSSSFLKSITNAVAKWTASQRQAFGPCMTAYQDIIRNAGGAYPTVEIQINAIINTTVHWQANSTLSVMLYSITIYFSDMVTVWGTVNSFCGCGWV